MPLRFLPAGMAPDEVVAVLGLISDTHMPQRLAVLPPTLNTVLAGVDLLLHAGDVGELWVLDRLSKIAPVVAVHGNDDTAAARRELPLQQVVVAKDVRVLLWHSHHQDPDSEMAARREDGWLPKLARRAERGRRAGAQVVVTGHTHVPMATWHGGMLVVNPGALAAGSALVRQRRQTVALLFLCREAPPLLSHVDLARPQQVHDPAIQWDAGFRAALQRYEASIVTPDLASYADRLRRHDYVAPQALLAAVLRLSHRCWAGKQPHITRADLLDAVAADGSLHPEDRDAVRAILNDPAERSEDLIE